MKLTRYLLFEISKVEKGEWQNTPKFHGVFVTRGDAMRVVNKHKDNVEDFFMSAVFIEEEPTC